MIDYNAWKKGIGSGILAGIAWGWLAVAFNTISGVFPFENSLLYNLVTASIGGAIYGIVVGCFLTLTYSWLPFKGSFQKAVFLTTCIWLILRSGGALLSLVNPDRFHPVMLETLQGFVLAVIMGCILGGLWKRQEKREI